MADEDIRFGPSDYIVFMLVPRIRPADYTTPDGLEHYVERVAICVFDDPDVAGYVKGVLNEDYRDGGPGVDFPEGATIEAVRELTEHEQVRAYKDLNDREEWKNELRRTALRHADDFRTVKVMTADEASGKSKEGHAAAVARSPSGNVILNGRGYPPRANGHLKKKLSNKQYDLVAALLKAGEEGLRKDAIELEVASARRMLKDLVDNDADWRSVIQMAEKTGQGYRILERSCTQVHMSAHPHSSR